MGANAQTSVPAFTAGQVLTAAQVTQINTGIPVFASSTERDAAFGGTGEKTLAEGQMAYLEDTDETQYYDGSSWSVVGGGGLVFISRTTVGSAVASVTVSGAFSSDYDAYRVVISNVDASNSTEIRMRFGAVVTGYYGSRRVDLYTGGTSVISRDSNAASVAIGATGTSDDTNVVLDVQNPNLAKHTAVHGTYHADGYSGWFGGKEASTTQHTAFDILPGAGTLTGGTIDVYGYAKA